MKATITTETIIEVMQHFCTTFEADHMTKTELDEFRGCLKEVLCNEDNANTLIDCIPAVEAGIPIEDIRDGIFNEIYNKLVNIIDADHALYLSAAVGAISMITIKFAMDELKNC